MGIFCPWHMSFFQRFRMIPPVKKRYVEKSRELVNSSNYRAVARMATVGMQTNDSALLERINAAVATGNIDHVQAVIAAIMAPPEYEEY